MPDELHYRHVMGHFATGVTIVTSRDAEGSPCGFTANAVASVSLDPALVLVCVSLEATSLPSIAESGTFCISVLDADDEGLARRFSEGEPSNRFEGVPFREEATGSPVLERALAWTDCRLQEIHRAGDHAIVLGEVVACDARDGDALLFFRGGYRPLGT